MSPAIQTHDQRIFAYRMKVGDRIGGRDVIKCPLCEAPSFHWGRGRAKTIYAHVVDVVGKTGTVRDWCEYPDHLRDATKKVESK